MTAPATRAWQEARDQRRARRTQARPQRPVGRVLDRDQQLDQLRDIRELMRRGYVRPLEAPPAVHQMARRRRDQADDTNQKEGT